MDLLADLRYAVRLLRKTPVFTVAAIGTLALGIGANTTIFSLVQTMLLRPLPYQNPDQVVMVWEDRTAAGFPRSVPAPGNYQDWRAMNRSFTDMAATAFAFANVTGDGTPEIVLGRRVTANFFSVLGVQPIVGRGFTESDDTSGARVVVISHALWHRRYAGAEEAIGRAMSIDRKPFTIVGVAPPGFFGPDVGRSVDVFVPLAFEPLLRGKESALDGRLVWWLSMMFRLRDGQTIDAATAALRAVQPQVRAETMPAERHSPDQGGYLETPMAFEPAMAGRSELRGRYQQPLTIVMAVVAATLLIACANIANLLLARAIARRHELSVRLALGASRLRLARQLFAESAMLTCLGALLGIAIAYWGTEALVAQLSTASDRVSLDLGLDWRVLGFTTAVAGGAALLFGAASALGLSGVSPYDAIQQQSRGVVGDRRFALRGALVVVQVSLSLALVVAAGLFTRTLLTLTSRDAGFDRSSVLIASIDLQRDVAPGPAKVALVERVRRAAANLPGASHAAIAFTTPVFNRGWNTEIATTNPALTGRLRMSWVNAVSPDYFSTFGIRLVAGRDFEPRDSVPNAQVAIVNQAFASRFLGANPLGQSFRQGRNPASFVVVGVVEDTVYRSLRSPMMPTMYLPFDSVGGSVLMAVRAVSGPPWPMARDVARIVQREAPMASVTFRSLEQQVNDSLSQERLVASIAGFFGALALLLAGLGLYGVAAYSVNRRRAEIGIRMALGASPGGVIRLVLVRIAWMVAIGLAIGIAITVWAGKFVGSLLYGLEPRDTLTLVAAAATLAIVALLAGWLPARRASRIDPTIVLRES